MKHLNCLSVSKRVCTSVFAGENSIHNIRTPASVYKLIMPLSPSCTAAQIGFADISRPPTWSFMFAATSIHEKPVSGEQSSLGNSRLNSGLSCDAVVTLVYRTVPPPYPTPSPSRLHSFCLLFSIEYIFHSIAHPQEKHWFY